MIIEKEMAWIAKTILSINQGITAYFNQVPQNFKIPSIFFPPAEVRAGNYTMGSYLLQYSWYLKFFAKSKGAAYQLAHRTMESLYRQKNKIALINEAGGLTGEVIRIKHAEMKDLDQNAYELMIEWEVVRPYDTQETVKMQKYSVEYLPAES